MPKKVTKAALLNQVRARFPDRWEVTSFVGKIDGDSASGAIKIHCTQDDRLFLSDFAAKFDNRGNVVDLTLDGVHVGKFIGKPHE